MSSLVQRSALAVNNNKCHASIRDANGTFVIPWNRDNIDVVPVCDSNTNITIPYSDEEVKWLQPVLRPLFTVIDDANDTMRVTWLGHSTVWINIEGVSILFDPVLVTRLPTARRLRTPPCSPDEFPKVDAVIISNADQFHLNIDTCRQLVEHFGKSLHFYVPINVGDRMRNAMKNDAPDNIIEMDWWDETAISDTLRLVCLPAQNYSSIDDNMSLWASWTIIGDRYRMLHIGASGYYAPLFSTIGQLFGPFDVACIPVGDNIPRCQLKCYRMNADEAVHVHIDVQSRQSIGIGWGTWFRGLGIGQHYMEPQNALRYAAERVNNGQLIDEYRRVVKFITMIIGQTWTSAHVDGLLYGSDLMID